MSEPLIVTRTPIQITDGTNSGHVTVTDGFIEYADSADSSAWHQAGRVLNVFAPWVIWLRVASGSEAEVIVTKHTG
ncbi:hypothetical protein BW31_01416 [Pantoea agglomerans]|nr:hypothetical protein BW31_01416 [Pantoea agglomerans]